MRKLVALLTLVVLVCGLAVPALAAYKDEYKMSVNVAAQSAWGKGAGKFAELLAEKSGGKINVKVYYSAQLMAGKQTSEFMIVRNGAADFALSSTINWSPQATELNLFALPFFISSQPNPYKALDAMEAGESGKMIADALEKKGVTVLGWGENGFRELTNGIRPIVKPEDMASMKIRVVGSPLYLDIFKALGANPINMNWGEAVTAFQQGVVDGQENPINSVILPYKVNEFHKYLTDWHYVVDPLMYAVNNNIWKSFSPEDQKLLLECVAEASKYQIALSRVGLDDGESYEYLKNINELPEVTEPYKHLEGLGMEIVRLNADQVKAFVEKTQPVFDAWKSKIGEDLVKAAEEDMASVK